MKLSVFDESNSHSVLIIPVPRDLDQDDARKSQHEQQAMVIHSPHVRSNIFRTTFSRSLMSCHDRSYVI